MSGDRLSPLWTRRNVVAGVGALVIAGKTTALAPVAVPAQPFSRPYGAC